AVLLPLPRLAGVVLWRRGRRTLCLRFRGRSGLGRSLLTGRPFGGFVLGQMALLVFLPGPAVAGIVPAQVMSLWFRHDWLFYLRRLDLQRAEQERVDVGQLVDHFRDRLAAAVAGLGLDADEDRRVAAGGRLQARGELLGQPRRHPVVGVRGGDQRRRVGGPLLHVVVRRVLVEERELLGVVGGAIFRDPEAADREQVIAQHVRHEHLADRRAEQAGALREHRAHQQSAVALALAGAP